MLATSAPAQPPSPLRADELLLVYNRLEPVAADLARHYADARNVPADRLCPLEVPSKTDEIGRADFERLIREPIREHLTAHKLRDKVRCLVTFHGLPIRVGPMEEVPRSAELQQKWQGELADGMRLYDRLVRELQGMSGGEVSLKPLTSQPGKEDFIHLGRAYIAARQAVFEHLSRLRQQGRGEEQSRRLLAIVEQVQGSRMMLDRIAPMPDADRAAAEQRLQQLRRDMRIDLDVACDLLALEPADPARNRGRMLLGRYEGLVALLVSLQNDLARLETEQTEAAVDSELALLWWRVYPRTRWVPNPLCWRWRADPAMLSSLPPGDRDEPVLMVSRLDAPTPSIVRRMIDDALAAEKNPPAGKVYIDARGIQRKEGLGEYDHDLRDLAALLRRDTDLPVTLDNRPELFQPRQCPDAMLYCGWYSLRKYVDAFTFVPGAVGYHIASFEAAGLHSPQETGWCRGLLYRGAAATLGPVAEPYLRAFPRPRDFFGLLLTGRFTLAECHAFSNPFDSWMMMLLGDPLYRPFGSKPLLRIEQVFETNLIPAEFHSPRG
ncbi:MAG TPA: TIGR03790 family protein [Phycisphaerae bacterium]|nr:TIGR03790 family protein [Phycisphaerae bacterium]